MEPNYAQHYRELWNRHWWWRSRRRFVLRLIEDIRRRQTIRHILDVGCGDGLFFEDLMAFAPTWGIEPDGQLLTPENPYRDRIDVGLFGQTPNTLRCYDLIVMLDVLEHIEDDAAAVRTLAASLEPEGRVVLTVPALPMLWSAHDMVNHHFRRYTKATLRQRLEANGLVVERIGYYFFWTTGPLLLRRWLRPSDAEGTDRGAYEVRIPGPVLNRLMQTISQWEHLAARRIRLPIGSSLFAIGRRARF